MNGRNFRMGQDSGTAAGGNHPPMETRRGGWIGKAWGRLGIAFLSSGLLLVLAVAAVALDGKEKDDPSAWTPIRIRGEQSAPEFEDVADWINSKPLTMKSLQGKVIVVHFLAFG